MPLFKRIIDFLTLSSDRPMRRLVAYYAALAVVVAVTLSVFPAATKLLLGGGLVSPDVPHVLPDALQAPQFPASMLQPGSLIELALITTLALAGTLLLMLPVSWVYMSARQTPGHNQAVAQTLIILPIVVAGIVFIVRDSLALAFSLAGVVAAVRFRTTLRDARDVVFIFLAIAVGFAAGVQSLAVGALLSVVFNFVLLFNWRYDFGRNVLEPTASAQWTEPLTSLARGNGRNGQGKVPDRDLVLALTPAKLNALAQRFDRVRNVLGPSKKKPRFNAVLSITSDKVGEAQALVQKVLDKRTKRWMLDEVVTNTGKPSEIYYLVRVGKSVTRDELITAIRARAGDQIGGVELELGESLGKKRREVGW